MHHALGHLPCPLSLRLFHPCLLPPQGLRSSTALLLVTCPSRPRRLGRFSALRPVLHRPEPQGPGSQPAAPRRATAQSGPGNRSPFEPRPRKAASRACPQRLFYPLLAPLSLPSPWTESLHSTPLDCSCKCPLLPNETLSIPPLTKINSAFVSCGIRNIPFELEAFKKCCSCRQP